MILKNVIPRLVPDKKFRRLLIFNTINILVLSIPWSRSTATWLHTSRWELCLINLKVLMVCINSCNLCHTPQYLTTNNSCLIPNNKISNSQRRRKNLVVNKNSLSFQQPQITSKMVLLLSWVTKTKLVQRPLSIRLSIRRIIPYSRQCLSIWMSRRRNHWSLSNSSLLKNQDLSIIRLWCLHASYCSPQNKDLIILRRRSRRAKPSLHSLILRLISEDSWMVWRTSRFWTLKE